MRPTGVPQHGLVVRIHECSFGSRTIKFTPSAAGALQGRAGRQSGVCGCLPWLWNVETTARPWMVD